MGKEPLLNRMGCTKQEVNVVPSDTSAKRWTIGLLLYWRMQCLGLSPEQLKDQVDDFLPAGNIVGRNG
jgi:hypothetical protein